MLDHMQVRNQRVVISVSKNGSMRHTLVVETNLCESDKDFDGLVEAVVEYLKANTQLAGAEIQCVSTPS